MKQFKKIVFLILISALFLYSGVMNASAMEDSRYQINPAYRHLFDNKPVLPFEKRKTTKTKLLCDSLESLASTLHDQFKNRVTDFQVHLEYDFQFSEVSDILSQALEEGMQGDDYTAFSYSRWSSSWSGYDGSVDITFEIDYLTTEEEELQIDQRVDEILNGSDAIIQSGMTDEEMEKAIHDWIVLNVAYDTTYTEHSAYAALFLGTTVCQGYSLLMYKMLDFVDIQAKIIHSESMNHAWNLTYICGNWYHVDVTWDDPVPDVEGRLYHTYFNLSDTEISTDHYWETEDYPEAPVAYEEGVCGNTVEDNCGDFNADGVVDRNDLVEKRRDTINEFNTWFNECLQSGEDCADMNGDGNIDIQDIRIRQREGRYEFNTWLSECYLELEDM